MKNTVDNLMDCLSDCLGHIYDIEMREHITMHLRMAQRTLDYAKQLKIEHELEREEEYASYMIEARQP